eukprot:8328715-Alexandrium_andersonii.AAC.1
MDSGRAPPPLRPPRKCLSPARWSVSLADTVLPATAAEGLVSLSQGACCLGPSCALRWRLCLLRPKASRH